MENWLAIADRHSPGSMDVARLFSDAVKTAGYEMETIATEYGCELVFPDGGAARSNWDHTRLAPFVGDSVTVLMVAAPLVWFDLSRVQKNRIDEIYRYLVPKKLQGRARECALILVIHRNENEVIEGYSRIFARFCSVYGLRNRGVLPLSTMELLH